MMPNEYREWREGTKREGTKRDGGPAFPDTGRDDRGMSLRDYFAGQALIGCIMRVEEVGYKNAKDDVAKAAYRIADAMLRARKAERP